MNKGHRAYIILTLGVIVVLFYFMATILSLRDAPPTSVIETNDDANSRKRENEKSFSVDTPPQLGRGGAKQTAVQAVPVEKNGHSTVWFDYDRGLDAIEKPWPLSREMEIAETQGAYFKFSFLVVDGKCTPIEGANVAIVAFQRRGSKVFAAKTGIDGIAEIDGFGTGEIHVEIDKDGYFHMSLSHWIFKPHLKCVSDGRWLPWNPLVEIQLTPIPVNRSAVERNSEFTSRERAGVYGFDLFSVTPSTSTNCDMLISVTEIPPDAEKQYPIHSYEVFFPGEGNGAQIVKKNLFSACPYPPVAPEDGYTNRLDFTGWNPIAEDEAVVFRIRNSDAEEPLYGVFRHPFLPIGTGLSFWFDVVVNVERGLKTLVPAVETVPPTKFFKLTPLESPSKNTYE